MTHAIHTMRLTVYASPQRSFNDAFDDGWASFKPGPSLSKDFYAAIKLTGPQWKREKAGNQLGATEGGRQA